MWTELLPEAGGCNLIFLSEAAAGGQKSCRDGGGGGMRSPGLAKNAGKMRKMGQKNAIENAVEWCLPLETVSSRLARSGAQSMDGLMEQLSAVVQLKNIMD